MFRVSRIRARALKAAQVTLISVIPEAAVVRPQAYPMKAWAMVRRWVAVLVEWLAVARVSAVAAAAVVAAAQLLAVAPCAAAAAVAVAACVAAAVVNQAG